MKYSTVQALHSIELFCITVKVHFGLRVSKILKLHFCPLSVKLGVEHASIIPDANLNASSSLGGNPNRGNKSTPSRGRLNKIRTKPGFIGAWCPNVADTNQWIQVDLVNTTYVTGVLTQGRSDDAQWVTKYKVQYQAPFNGPLLDVKDQSVKQ